MLREFTELSSGSPGQVTFSQAFGALHPEALPRYLPALPRHDDLRLLIGDQETDTSGMFENVCITVTLRTEPP